MNTLNIGLIGKHYAGMVELAAGLQDALERARPIALGSGSIRAFAEIIDAWVFLHEEGLEEAEFLRETGCPVVSRVRATLPMGIPAVLIDDGEAAQILAMHCLSEGAAKLCFSGVAAPFADRRGEAVKRIAVKAGVPFERQDDHWELIDSLGREFRDETDPLSSAALIAMNDGRALQCMTAALETRIRIPEQLRIAGFDNKPLPDFPGALPLTSVALPDRAQGKQVGVLIKRMLDGEKLGEYFEMTPVTDFHYRESTRGAHKVPATPVKAAGQ